MSSQQPDQSVRPDAAAEAAASAGTRLRRAREARGESVHEVAFALKLRPRQIEALERDDFAALPGMAFVRGFIRNYARYVGVDAAPLLDSLQHASVAGSPDLAPISNADGDLPSGSGSRRASFPLGAVVVVLVALVLAGWYFDWFQTEPATTAGDDTSEAVPAFVQAPMQPISPPAVEPPAAEEAAAAAANGGSEDSAAPAAVSEPTAGTAAAGGDGSVQAEATPAQAAAPEAAADGAGRQLVFRFGADSWVEVRDASGSILHSGTNRAGSSRTVQGTPPFVLVVGNASSVNLEFDGQPVDLAKHVRGSVARLTLR